MESAAHSVSAQATEAEAVSPKVVPLAPEVTILMPCLNEKATLATCIGKARSFLNGNSIQGEVLVADNGSTDGSQAIAIGAGARVVAVPERGYGAALLAGIGAARGRYIIMGDADDSYDFVELGTMLNALRAGNDLVMGNRFRGGIAKGAMPPLHRYLGNPVLSFVGRLFFPVTIGDFHCGLRGFSRAAIADLKLSSPGMEFASEMVVKASPHGLSIAEVPVTLSPDGRGRPPHLNTWRDGWRHLRFLLLHCPRWLFLYPGIALIAAGVLGTAFLAEGDLRVTPHFGFGIHSLVASSFAVMIGTQLVILAALARRWGMTEGFLPARQRLQRILFVFNLETILKGAALMLLCGFAGVGWAIARWIAVDLGDLGDPSVLRVLVISFTAISVAIQAAAAGFFESILAIRRR